MGFRVFAKGQPPVTVDTLAEATKLMKAAPPETAPRRRGPHHDPSSPIEITLSEEDFLRSLPQEDDAQSFPESIATLDLNNIKK